MTRDDLKRALDNIPAGHLRLRAAFAITGKRQTVVARRVGISNSTLSRIADGSRPISTDEQRGIARAFGLTVEDIFGQEAAA